jgi:membrane protein DedA with SNARE-associated domain
MGITEFIAAWGTRIVDATGHLGVFLLMTAESMILPVPSEAVMPFVGFLVAEGSMSSVTAIGAATLGSLVGSLVSYAVGRYGGRPLVARYGRYLLITEEDLDRADRFFKRRGATTILLARFVPVVRHVISIPAGVARMKLLPFCIFTIAGAGAWNAILVCLGALLRRNWETILRYARWVDLAVVGILVGAVVLFVVRHVRRRAA